MVISCTIYFLLVQSIYASCKGEANGCKEPAGQGSNNEEFSMVQRFAGKLENNTKQPVETNGSEKSAVLMTLQKEAGLNATEEQMKEETKKAGIPPRRRLLLWQSDSPDAPLRFMYDPIMSTLKKAASLTLDDKMWRITQRWGDPRDLDAVQELESLKCGDVFIWIGCDHAKDVAFWAVSKQEEEVSLPSTVAARMLRVADELGIQRLNDRGIITVYYQTEPMSFQRHTPPICDLQTSLFTEIWDYSQVNIRRLFEHCRDGVRPVTRYVPPGPLDVLTARRDDIIDECHRGVGFLGTINEHKFLHRTDYLSQFKVNLQSKYPNFTDVNTNNAIWDYDAFGSFINQSCVQLSIHKLDSKGMAFEAVRAAPMLSGGAIMLYENCEAEDKAVWDGIVFFAKSPEDAGRQAATLLQSSSEERKTLARMRAKLFDERFEPATVWRNAGILDDWKTSSALDTLAACQGHAT